MGDKCPYYEGCFERKNAKRGEEHRQREGVKVGRRSNAICAQVLMGFYPLSRIIGIATIPYILTSKPKLEEIAIGVVNYFADLDCTGEENDHAKKDDSKRPLFFHFTPQ